MADFCGFQVRTLGANSVRICSQVFAPHFNTFTHENSALAADTAGADNSQGVRTKCPHCSHPMEKS